MKNDYEIRGDVTAIFLKRKDGTIYEALINSSDLDRVKEFSGTWYASSESSNEGLIYVIAKTPRVDGVQKGLLLHRWITEPPKGLVVDHINHNPLDNRRCNLRVVTQGQNNQNKRFLKKNKSGVKNVYWKEKDKAFRASFKVNGKTIEVGGFKNIKEAERAVKIAKEKYMPFSEERTKRDAKLG